MQMSALPHDVAPAGLPHDRERTEEVELDAIPDEQHALGTERAVHELRGMGGVQPVRDGLDQPEREVGVE
jgi:hypothetical protein